MEDPYKDNMIGPEGLGRSGRLVTPSDDEDLPVVAKSLFVGAAGDISFIPALNEDEDVITVADAPVGLIVPYQVRRVMDTGTTATVFTIES
ncbi:hypothetical protein [Mesorhizobium sp. WSM3876]|uniref:spike base protein, RCAP_Rcc01079 family n=1 Tax=Mesorhizobium sp. WSM3876 TaxID=422277 RepID=UPI000BAEB8FC|nr:hypothetical protein [Mesorhizobium sp. WSM3876]PBB85730.1 hypothetical protein CK216_16515 [Mesorhizobium sp. WSM3876]